MALGGKLGSAFGAIGSGLSFIPGPWSALGAVFSVAGQAASAVGAKKDQKQEQEQETAQPQQAEQQDPSRPEQDQIEGNQNQPLTMPGLGQNTFQPQQPNLGNYQSQLDAGIADLLLRDIDPGGL
jgi:hypothetical protein